MPGTTRALSNNRIATSPHYARILREYNDRFAKDGKVNAKRFFEEVVAPLVPDYSLRSWYDFIRRFQTTVGLMAANVAIKNDSVSAAVEENKIEGALMSNAAATASFIQAALNISAQRAAEILRNPSLLTNKEAIELGIKAMKAQDSRIHAIGKVREDNREEEKLNRAFESADFNNG